MNSQNLRCPIQDCLSSQRNSEMIFCESHYRKLLKYGDFERNIPIKRKKLTQSHKDNMSKARIKYCLENGLFNKKLNQKFRNSKDYRSWRNSVLKRDNYTCVICNERSLKMHADHIVMASENLNLRFSTDNGRTLCYKCHYEITFHKEIPVGSKWGHNMRRIK